MKAPQTGVLLRTEQARVKIIIALLAATLDGQIQLRSRSDTRLERIAIGISVANFLEAAFSLGAFCCSRQPQPGQRPVVDLCTECETLVAQWFIESWFRDKSVRHDLQPCILRRVVVALVIFERDTCTQFAADPAAGAQIDHSGIDFAIKRGTRQFGVGEVWIDSEVEQGLVLLDPSESDLSGQCQ